jgi:hypothetical protein
MNMITAMDMIMFSVTTITMTMPTTSRIVARHTMTKMMIGNTRKNEAKG